MASLENVCKLETKKYLAKKTKSSKNRQKENILIAAFRWCLAVIAKN